MVVFQNQCEWQNELLEKLVAESEGSLVRALCERFGIALSAHEVNSETAESRRVEHDARFLALSIPLDKARLCVTILPPSELPFSSNQPICGSNI